MNSSKADNQRFPWLKIERLSTMTGKRRDEILARSLLRMEAVQPLVETVMKDVQRGGNKSLLKYTRKFDGVKLSAGDLVVTKAEIKKAYRQVAAKDKLLLLRMEETLACVEQYHKIETEQLRHGLRSRWEGDVEYRRWGDGYALKVGQLKKAIGRVGVYVPGGNAPLFTTAIMGVTPAKVAGVPEIVVCSPPSCDGDIDPMIIVAADLAGATSIIRAGGAQAIAAMAYGTATIPKVFKIFGPGNVYVAAAKAYVASRGTCAIDFLAGPSEIVVIADDDADIEWIARDMVSQAEHDKDACAILLTDSSIVAEDVIDFIQNNLLNAVAQSGDKLAELAIRSLSEYGAVILVDSIAEAVEFANDFAPEHLEIVTRNPKNWLEKVRNAGAIFLGHFSAVADGDYGCPNHILPTGGAARYTSGLNVDMFMKKPATLKVPKKMREKMAQLVEVLSNAEGLYNQHGLSVKARADRERIPARKQLRKK